jgi:uncharacterized membrane protein
MCLKIRPFIQKARLLLPRLLYLPLITGLLGIAAAFTGWARRYNQIFGIFYIIIGLAGLVYPGLYFNERFLELMHVNALDHVLHLVVGIVATAVGFSSADYPGRAATPVR